MITLFEYKAKVVKVVDGDTVDVEIDLGFNHKFKTRLRLFGINTPELRGEERPKGLEAKNYVKERIYNKNIVIRTYKDKTGKYGRYLADIFYGDDERNLNQELLEIGLAMPQ